MDSIMWEYQTRDLVTDVAWYSSEEEVTSAVHENK